MVRNAHRSKCPNSLKIVPVESPTVATYPLAGGRREAHGCILQGRKTHEIATNIYSRKTLGKTKSESTNFKNKRFGSCFYSQGRYQHPMRPSQRITSFNQMCKIMTFNLFYFSFFIFLGSTKARLLQKQLFCMSLFFLVLMPCLPVFFHS